ncbi:MAG: DNA polymerase III subunit delta [Alphaproteobacteria bacterium]|nr:DNA polymerase III subunit delta [Alphaproteobacteria bacterium]
MKLSFRQIEPFVKKPDPAALVVLVYGPDDGLMRERAKTIALSAVTDLNDPFNVAVLSSDILVGDPARLSDEANAISMLGGKRLVRIEDASDKVTTFVKDYLKNPNPHALIVLEAGELTTRSSLRILCEKAANAAAVPCYVEEARDLVRFIRETLQGENINAEQDAVTFLASAIAGDRGRARAEVEKLIIYKNGDTAPVSLGDAQACCGDSGEKSLDDLIYGVGNRNSAAALAAYHHLTEEGVAFIAALRALQNHFRRLHITKAKMQNGDSAESAMKSLSPPIFFKQEDAFRRQLQSWSLPALEKALSRLLDLEAQCKQTGMPAETLCAQAVLSLSVMRG